MESGPKTQEFAPNKKFLNQAKVLSENQNMKKRKFLLFFAALIFCQTSFAATKQVIELTDEEALIADMVTRITKVGEPYLEGDYIIFTANKNARHVGIAFDFENYKTVHSFKLKKLRDFEDNLVDSFYFYIQKLPKTVQEINYRLVIDGLWTLDPQNKVSVYSQDTKLLMSHFDASREIPLVTEEIPDGIVRFVYEGKSGEEIRLGGSFTNWDSYIYWMQEVSPGLYQFDLHLPPGTYEYAFFSGIKSFPDKTNPTKCYTADGKIASLLVVK